MKMILGLTLAVLCISSAMAGIHPSHQMAHELFRRQAVSEEDCTVDDCMMDDGCITEESYNEGTFDSCFIEPLQVGFTQTTVAVQEGLVVVLTIALNENAWITEPVTVMYSTGGGTATSDDDYTSATDVPVTFALGEYSKDIQIQTLVNAGDEPVESFNVTLTTECCAEIKNGLAVVEIRETGVSGDPHFTVPLMSGKTLCYSVQGYPGLTFNLISNDHIAINAMFIDSINDETEATWIGKLAIVPRGGEDYQSIILDSTNQQVIIDNQGDDQGEFKATVVQELHIYGHNNISVKFTKGMARQTGNPVVRVIYAKPLAIFDVTFHSNHLDVDWKMQDDMIKHSHGLMGQFMVKGIEIDEVKGILIRPGFEAVPVEKTVAWSYNKGQGAGPCWKAMNPGHQGEGLIEGGILNYLVENLLDKDFAFSNYKQV